MLSVDFLSNRFFHSLLFRMIKKAQHIRGGQHGFHPDAIGQDDLVGRQQNMRNLQGLVRLQAFGFSSLHPGSRVYEDLGGQKGQFRHLRPEQDPMTA